MWTKLLIGLVGGGVLIALAAMLIGRMASARYEAGRMAERSEWQEVAAKAERITLNAALELERRKSAGQTIFHERVVAMQPIVQRSEETVRVYEQTPAGRAPCLSAGRVLGIEADRAALFPGYAITAPGGTRALLPRLPVDGLQWRLDGRWIGSGNPEGGH